MKLPALQFYPGDWRKDPGVQSLNYFDRGVWFEILCLMHESSERGKLLLNGQPMPDDALATILGLDKQILTSTLNTLLTYGVASRDQETGALINRRMVKDEDLRQKRTEAGKLGGNPVLVKQKTTKRRPRLQANGNQPPKQNPTPSSSSSTSSSEEKKERSRTSLAMDVFAFWQEHLNHPHAVFDPKREAIIAARIAAGYTVEDLKDAVRGCALSDFHMGREPGRTTIHDGVALIFRDAEHVDMFIAKARSNGNSPRRVETLKEQLEREAKL